MADYLFVLGAYYPTPSANGICIKNIVEALRKKENKVSIICLGSEQINKIGEYGEHVYVIKDPLLTKKRRLSSKLNNVIKYPFWPIKSFRKVYSIQKCIIKLYKNKEFDTLIGVNKPLDGLLASLIFSIRNKDFPFYAYYLDPLASGSGPAQFDENWIKKRGLKWENLIAKKAKKVYVMNSHSRFYEQIKIEPLISKIQYADIPLMTFDNSIYKDELYLKADGINIVYTGTFVKNLREPKILIKILTQFETDKKVYFHFFGDIDDDMKDSIMSVSNNFINILFYGNKSMEEIIPVIYSADFLLNIGAVNPIFIPSKLFQYINTGNPIIQLSYSEEDSSLEYLNKYPNHVVLYDMLSGTENSKKLTQFLELNRSIRVDISDIEDIFYKNSPDYFIELVQRDREV